MWVIFFQKGFAYFVKTFAVAISYFVAESGEGYQYAFAFFVFKVLSNIFGEMLLKNLSIYFMGAYGHVDVYLTVSEVL